MRAHLTLSAEQHVFHRLRWNMANTTCESQGISVNDTRCSHSLSPSRMCCTAGGTTFQIPKSIQTATKFCSSTFIKSFKTAMATLQYLSEFQTLLMANCQMRLRFLPSHFQVFTRCTCAPPLSFSADCPSLGCAAGSLEAVHPALARLPQPPSTLSHTAPNKYCPPAHIGKIG